MLAHNSNIMICSNESAFHPALRTQVATTPGGILRPKDIALGFMTRDGKLIGHGLASKVGGHQDLASRLPVSNLKGKIKSGDVIPFTIYKDSSGRIVVSGSQSMSEGLMSQATRDRIKNLFE